MSRTPKLFREFEGELRTFADSARAKLGEEEDAKLDSSDLFAVIVVTDLVDESADPATKIERVDLEEDANDVVVLIADLLGQFTDDTDLASVTIVLEDRDSDAFATAIYIIDATDDSEEASSEASGADD